MPTGSGPAVATETPETPDIETASEDYARRFAGPVGSCCCTAARFARRARFGRRKHRGTRPVTGWSWRNSGGSRSAAL